MLFLPKLATIELFSISMILSFQEYYINRIVYYATLGTGLFHSAYFTGDSSRLLYVSTVFSLLLLSRFHGMYVSQFVTPFTCWRTFRMFPVWGYLLCIKMLWTFTYKTLCGYASSFLLSRYLRWNHWLIRRCIFNIIIARQFLRQLDHLTLSLPV